MRSYEMARALCEAGLAGIAIVDILSEFGESAVKELHADFGLYVVSLAILVLLGESAE
jgi:sorbose reductase